MRPKRILVLFPSTWDRRHLSHPKYRGRYDFIFYDHELWTFPRGLWRIMRFDPVAYIDKVERDCARSGVDGVLSTDEYIGTIIASAVARRFGLPSNDPEVVLQASHKYYARLAQRQIASDAVPDFQLMSVPPPKEDELTLAFPMFVKPVRGSFSIFSARCDDYRGLRRHLDINAMWRMGLRRVLRPFNELLRHFTGYRVDVNRFLGEAVITGHQVCIDGFVREGRVTFVGVVDEECFPGTHTFERFVYPSALPGDVLQRMYALAERLVLGLGLSHGPFNVEMMYEPATDDLKLIELHPRISYQFADMFQDVDGTDSYEIMLDLAVGREPAVQRAAGRFAHSGSLVIRKFAGRSVRTVPCAATIDAFRTRHPGARVEITARPGRMDLEMRAMGSYRCALINAGAHSREALSTIRADADAMLRFDIV